jgi:RpiR family glv operon transcriptional regulator
MNISDQAGKCIGRLGETDILILNYILKNKDACCRYTIEALADKCNVSRTTVLRFAQKLGFSGYSEMKSSLRWECARVRELPADALETVCADYHKFIDDMKDNDCEEICRILHGASRVFIYGTGALQSDAAREFKRFFMLAQLCMYHIEGTEIETAMAAEMIDGKDAAVIISFSGESPNGVEFAALLKSRGTPLISITRQKNNSLARLCNQNLYISSSEVDSFYRRGYETTSMFFLTAEMLMLKYLLYLQRLQRGNS